jgi:hypothetical protein
MGKMSKAAGVAGLAIAGGLAVAAKVGFSELMAGQAVAAQTEAVLKSTGGAANVTAAGLDRMALSMLKKTGVDDEAIKTGANLLLTFTNIRNETGKGNRIFDQTTQTMLDMSTALGQDAKQSAIQLGKALNDPIRGVTALQRVGVTFTAAQKEQIKALVESGNVMGAQKLVLAELNKEFGGSAEAAGKTLAGQLNVAKESFSNLMAEIVGAVLPAFEEFVGMATRVTAWMTEHPKVAKIVVVALGGLAAALLAVSVASKLAAVSGALASLAFVGLGQTATLTDKLMRLTLIGGLLTLGTMLVLAWQRSETFRDVVNGVFGAVRAAAGAFLGAITGVVGNVRAVFAGISDWLRDHWKQVLLVLLTGLPGALWLAFSSKWGEAFRDKAKEAFVGIRDWIKEHIVDAIVGFFRDLPGRIMGALGDLPGAVAGKLGKLDPRGWGDAFAPDMDLSHVSGINLMGALPIMGPFASQAAAYGLRVTSGLRPGAITASGKLSDHAVGKALDVSNGYNTPQMAAFFRALIGNPRVKQAFYDPLGSIFGGVWSSYRQGGHSDHVHVATYDKGGWLKPGWNLAFNGLGRPEPVGGGGVTVYINGPVYGANSRELAEKLAPEIRAQFYKLKRITGPLRFE